MNIFHISFIVVVLCFVSSCSNIKWEDTNADGMIYEEREEIKEEFLESHATTDVNGTKSRVVTIQAKKFEYDTKEIRAQQWERLIIKIDNTDVLHWIGVPDMQLVWDYEIEIDTNQTWEFEFVCANYCWSKHREMKWKIIIE